MGKPFKKHNRLRKVPVRRQANRHEPSRSGVFEEILWYLIESTEYQGKNPRADTERFYKALNAVFGKDSGGRPGQNDSRLLADVDNIIVTKKVSVRSAVLRVIQHHYPDKRSLLNAGEYSQDALSERLSRKYRELRKKHPEQTVPDVIRREIEQWDEERRKAAIRFMEQYWP